MVAYPISDAAAAQYRGCGHALAAIAQGEAVAISYLGDIVPDLSDEDAVAELVTMADDRVLKAAVRLSSHGDVVAAMCSSWEIVDLGALMPKAP